MIEQYAPQGVEFYALQKPGSHGQLPENLRHMKVLDALPGADQIRNREWVPNDRSIDVLVGRLRRQTNTVNYSRELPLAQGITFD